MITKIAQFVFIVLAIVIIISQYFMEGIIKKDVPMELLFLIIGIAAGIKDIPGMFKGKK